MYRAMGASLLATNEQILIDETPTSSSKCPTRTGMCITSEGLKAAKKACPTTSTTVRGIGLAANDPKCTAHGNKIGAANLKYYDACWARQLPLCGTPTTYIPPLPPPVTAPPSTTYTPQDEDPPSEDDDGSSYMVGGILAVLILGGVGYSVFKYRKKKRGRR